MYADSLEYTYDSDPILMFKNKFISKKRIGNFSIYFEDENNDGVPSVEVSFGDNKIKIKSQSDEDTDVI